MRKVISVSNTISPDLWIQTSTSSHNISHIYMHMHTASNKQNPFNNFRINIRYYTFENKFHRRLRNIWIVSNDSYIVCMLGMTRPNRFDEFSEHFQTASLYALKHQIVEMRGDVTDAGRTTDRTTEDRATQPMEAGGWVSQFDSDSLSEHSVD